MLKLLILYDNDVDISYINEIIKTPPLSIFTKIETMEVQKAIDELDDTEYTKYRFEKSKNQRSFHRDRYDIVMKQKDENIRINDVRHRMEKLIRYYGKLGFYFSYIVNYDLVMETYYYKETPSRFRIRKQKEIKHLKEAIKETEDKDEKKILNDRINKQQKYHDEVNEFEYPKEIIYLQVFANFFNRTVVMTIKGLNPEQAGKIFQHEWSHIVFREDKNHLDSDGHCSNSAIDKTNKDTAYNCLMSTLVDIPSIDIAKSFCKECHIVLLNEELHPNYSDWEFLL